MADQTTLEVIINSHANLGGIAETETALKGMSAQAQAAGIGFTSGHNPAAKEAAVVERDLEREASSAARAFGALGLEGAKATDRLLSFGALMGLNGGIGGEVAIAIGALTGLAMVLKGTVDNTEAMDRSERGLDQALRTVGSSLAENKGWIDQFLQSNVRFIDNQYAAREAIASVIRAGEDQATVQRMAADALDLSAAKNISYADALKGLEEVSVGNAKGLRDLGFSAKEVTEIMKESTASGGGFAGVLDALEPRITGSADSLTNTTKSSRELNAAWQNLTGQGSGLADMLAGAENRLAQVFTALDRLNQGPLGKTIEMIGWLIDHTPNALAAYNLFNRMTPSDTTPNEASAVATDQHWAAQPTAWDHKAAQQYLITINNNGIQDPEAAGFVTANQIATLMGPR